MTLAVSRLLFRQVHGEAVLTGVLAAGLATAWSWRPSYWYDEAASLSAAGRSTSDLLGLLGHIDAVHGLYYVVLSAWMSLFGASETATRSLSAIGVGVACAGVNILGTMLGGRPLGLAAGGFAVVLPGLAWSGTEAREYSWTAAAAVVATLLLLRADRSGRPTHWAWYAVAVTISSYLFVYSLLLLPAHAATLLLSRRPVRRWLVSASVAAFLTAPLLALAATQMSRQLGWLSIGPKAMVRDAVLRQYFIGSAQGTRPILTSALVLALTTVACTLLAVSAAHHDPTLRHPLSVALPWAVIPTTIVITTSLITQPVYQPRYLTFTAPAVALLLGSGLLGIRRALPRMQRHKVDAGLAILCLLWVAASTPILVAQRAVDSKSRDNYRALAAFIGPPGHDLHALIVTRPGALSIVVAYPHLTGQPQLSNLRAGAARSRSLWGTLTGPTGISPRFLDDGEVGLVTRTRGATGARAWRRWLHRHQCHPTGAHRQVRFTVHTFRCPKSITP